MSDFSVYKKLEVGRIGSSKEIANALQPIAQTHQREQSAFIANASAATAETPIGVSIYAANLANATFCYQKAAVANSTDYALLTLSKRTGSGAAVVMATANLSNVALTAFVPVAFTVANVANATTAAGDVVTLTSTNTGNGIANNGTATVNFTLEDIA